MRQYIRILCVDPLKRFTAEQASAHPWLTVEASSLSSSLSADLPQQGCPGSGIWKSTRTFLQSLLWPGVRTQDVSFGLGPHVICKPQSRPFTCKSSFPKFLVEPPTLTLISYGFSFCSNGRSSSVELASRILSTPRFTSCSPSLGPKEVTHAAGFSGSVVSSSATCTGADLEKPFTSPDSFPSSRNDTWSSKEELTNCKRTSRTSLTTMAIHNKRNRTIRLGEFDQLDTGH